MLSADYQLNLQNCAELRSAYSEKSRAKEYNARVDPLRYNTFFGDAAVRPPSETSRALLDW